MANKKRIQKRKKKKIQMIDIVILALAVIILFSIFVSIIQGRKVKKAELEKLENAYIRENAYFKELEMDYYNDEPDRILFKTKNSKRFYSFKNSEKSFGHLLEVAEDAIQQGSKTDYTYTCFAYDDIEEIKKDKNNYIIFDYQSDEKKDNNYVFAYKIEDEESILYKNLEYYKFLKFRTSGKDVTFERKYERIVEENFINISTVEELKNIDGNKNYKLTKDIDFENTAFLLNINFKGIFDGNGYSLKNIKISEEDLEKYDLPEVSGMIFKNEGIIRNLKITDINIDIKNENRKINKFGVLVGENSGAIENCSLESGNIKIENSSIAGITYYSTFGEIKKCTNKARIENASAGIVCDARISDVIDCTNEGILIGNNVSGIVSSSSGEVSNCLNLGDITATYPSAGIALSANLGIKNCTNKGNINSENAISAGITLNVEKILENCVNTGDITGCREVAGIAIVAGSNENIEIKGCKNEGTIKLNDKKSEIYYKCISGIVCEVTYGNITECFNTGKLEFTEDSDLDSGDIISRKTSEVTSDINLDNVHNLNVEEMISGSSAE